ncbi:MAG: LexA family transcriptional regulator [Paludibacteraceae bacterium]|nr:LexA family transcriptional regulator [Paludibacteraceae bacterium]
MSTIKERVYLYCKEKNIKIRDFERASDLSNGYISSMRTGFGHGKLNNVLLAFPDLNREWLLYGEGSMLKTIVNDTTQRQCRDNAETVPTTPTAQNEQQPNENTPQRRTLPLIPIDAVAGYNGWDEPGINLIDCTQYEIPDFQAVHADFLIRVSGSSMYPKYSSGDILACRKIDEITFLQWGKIYVIDSRQGAMVKRIFEIDDDPTCISCVSDNEKYPPFKLPKSEIRSLSIVVGAIRLE